VGYVGYKNWTVGMFRGEGVNDGRGWGYFGSVFDRGRPIGQIREMLDWNEEVGL